MPRGIANWGPRFGVSICITAESLLPLAAAALKSGDKRYLIKAKSIIDAWIVANPRSTGGVGWDSYVISMRVTQWLAFYGEVRVLLEEDSAFIDRMNQSLAEQYAFLADHLEKDILGNHYLENLKALVLLSCYFRDEATLRHLMPVLEEQIAEQILPDGMHFELSPMYHKVILECLMRIACTLQAGEWARDVATLCRLQDMCDCLYSLEHDADRTPLFNDSGDNVAKSRDALLACAREQFGLAPRLKDCLPDAGYYFLRGTIGETEVKVIFDAGRPGPEFAAGHAHCDMLSFEAFVGASVVGEYWHFCLSGCASPRLQANGGAQRSSTSRGGAVGMLGTLSHGPYGSGAGSLPMVLVSWRLPCGIIGEGR